MKNLLSKYDMQAARLVSLLPKMLYEPLIWLGRLTTPLLWASYIAGIHILFLASGGLSYGALLVIALLPLASVIKLFFRRERPPTVYVEGMKIRSYSFPSSHAYAAALGGGYVASLLFQNGHAATGVFIVSLILLIGISRIRIGAHYPSDVTAGWALGAIVLIALSYGNF